MIHTTTQKRVRYGETDQMGYLYYGRYPMLYEIGRSEMIRDLGFTYREMESELNVMMPVLHLDSRYLRPAKYDDLLTIHSKVIEMPSKMIHYQHEVYNEAEELLNRGSVKLFFIDMTSNKRVSCPTPLANKFNLYF